MRSTVPIFQIADSQQNAGQADSFAEPQSACLVKIYPANVRGNLIPLDRDQTTLGRDESCDYELVDDFASREHAVIRRNGGQYTILDLGSTNGTHVNDERIEGEHPLSAGDQIRVGHHIFKFLSSDHVEAMYHEAVFQMMTKDALTGTYNRRYFEDAFHREVTRSVRHARTLGVLFIDIDEFKRLNDDHGHLVGDEILAAMCKRLMCRIREDELFARIGGEEFALAVVEISRESLVSLADQIRELVSSQPFATTAGDISITVSIGVAHTNGLEPIHARELIGQADEQLYQAKRNGRNCVRIEAAAVSE